MVWCDIIAPVRFLEINTISTYIATLVHSFDSGRLNSQALEQRLQSSEASIADVDLMASNEDSPCQMAPDDRRGPHQIADGILSRNEQLAVDSLRPDIEQSPTHELVEANIRGLQAIFVTIANTLPNNNPAPPLFFNWRAAVALNTRYLEWRCPSSNRDLTAGELRTLLGSRFTNQLVELFVQVYSDLVRCTEMRKGKRYVVVAP